MIQAPVIIACLNPFVCSKYADHPLQSLLRSLEGFPHDGMAFDGTEAASFAGRLRGNSASSKIPSLQRWNFVRLEYNKARGLAKLDLRKVKRRDCGVDVYICIIIMYHYTKNYQAIVSDGRCSDTRSTLCSKYYFLVVFLN